MFLSKLIVVSALIVLFPGRSPAAGTDLKPGDVIGPHNWQRVQGMVGENLLNRIKGGYTFRIKETQKYNDPKEYIEATERYAGNAKLGSQGELLNYVAGRPFPRFDPSDPQAGLKLAWNFYWRWGGDDYELGGGGNQPTIVSYVIEKTGSERGGKVRHYYMETRGRVTVPLKPSIPGYEHIDWMQLRMDEYPRDTSGKTTLEVRYAKPDHEDDFWIYIPSIRRVRRTPPIQRCATLAPTEFTSDDIKGFNGKITRFNYNYLGEQQMLGNFSQEQVPFRRKTGDYLPLNEAWEILDSYVLEVTPKDPDYCYPKKILYLDKSSFEPIWVMVWDKQGRYWKEQVPFRKPVRLSDGQQVLSPATIIIVNVQNGRSTVTTSVRAYNQGYRPSLFTLQTLQTVMRGGSLR